MLNNQYSTQPLYVLINLKEHINPKVKMDDVLIIEWLFIIFSFCSSLLSFICLFFLLFNKKHLISIASYLCCYSQKILEKTMQEIIAMKNVIHFNT
ncbi:hypothetical protein RFI_38863 [Reticulomyxa filosa]|uniref:Uncharacterized protein n=1 Tax=Reticulomyxa filosa TaxID=46433 RepID=X6LB73_RETFI|nr:hypothetical protein RFI_38863 [Reticulomyxa filosa]|eukprot:ETN98630.1 hypothetical protein RFI_38863 [Reticulomyxa filosa]